MVVRRSSGLVPVTQKHLEAAIAWVHARAPQAKDTDWGDKALARRMHEWLGLSSFAKEKRQVAN